MRMSICWLAAAVLVSGVCRLVGSAERVELSWEWETPRQLPQAIAVDHGHKHLFAALKTGGVVVLDVQHARPRQVAAVPADKLAGLDAMNLVLVGDRLYVALGDFFGPKSHAGLAVIDVSNPARPSVFSVWKSPKVMKGAAVVAVSGKHAFVGAMNHGVMTFDISDPKAIKHLATLQPDVNFPRRNPGRVQHPNARGMAVAGDLLYVAYDAGGLRVLDVRNPAKPREVGRYINAAMAGKQQAYNNIVIDGRRAFIAVDYAGLEIVDISNPAKIKQIGWWNPWRADTPRNLWFNSPGHTNQLIYDGKRQLVLLSAGDAELQVVDVSKPDRPTLAVSHGEEKNKQGVWGLAAADDRVYLAYIQTFVPFRGAWAGIKAVEIR